MSITFVQSTSFELASGTTGVGMGLSGVTAGNLLVLTVASHDSTNGEISPTSLVDADGNTWLGAILANADSPDAGKLGVNIYYVSNCKTDGGGGVNVTVNFASGTASAGIVLAEVTSDGGAGDLGFNVSSAVRASGNDTAPTVTVTPTTATNRYFVAALAWRAAGGDALTAPSGWTNRWNDPAFGDGIGASYDDRTGTGAQTATWALNNTRNWVAVGATFNQGHSGDGAARTGAFVMAHL